MDTDFEIYKGKSFKDLCKDICSNQEHRKEQIEVVIADLRPLIKTHNDALMVVPLIKGYLDSGISSDEHLVKLAGIVQRLITAQSSAEATGGTYSLSDEEKKLLWKELDNIVESDKVVGVKIEDKKKTD
jgi:hypothetical protein